MNYPLRILLATPLALATTFGLFFIMASLLDAADKPVKSRHVVAMPDILMPEKHIETRRKQQLPPKPEIDRTPPPAVPPLAVRQTASQPTQPLQLDIPKWDGPGVKVAMGSGLKATDGEYLPVVKVAPSYPRNAIRRGIEGYVILEYVVLPDGSVTDIRVVEASPPNVFDAAAIRSAKRYKYKPRVENGQAIRVEGVQTKIVFKLE